MATTSSVTYVCDLVAAGCLQPSLAATPTQVLDAHLNKPGRFKHMHFDICTNLACFTAAVTAIRTAFTAL